MFAGTYVCEQLFSLKNTKSLFRSQLADAHPNSMYKLPLHNLWYQILTCLLMPKMASSSRSAMKMIFIILIFGNVPEILLLHYSRS